MKEVCQTCNQVIRKKRSTDISDHLHAHITQIARELALDREYVYHRVLLLAVQIETEGGDPYPYSIIDDVLYPARTSSCTNKEIMTAVEAAHMFAAELGIYLNEKEITQ